ncbi:MAG: glycosyltransferase family 32 protein, partial [Thermomicrobiales bacterium]
MAEGWDALIQANFGTPLSWEQAVMQNEPNWERGIGRANAIPAMLHIIVYPQEVPWGTDQVLAHYRQMLPGWEIRVWTGETLRMFPDFVRFAADPSMPWIVLADLARILILERFGGVYLDLDFWIQQDLRPLLAAGTPFIGGELASGETVASNAVLGAPARHPAMIRVKEAALEVLIDRTSQSRLWLGPPFWNTQAGEGEWRLLPASMFAPVPFSNRLRVQEAVEFGLVPEAFA